MKIYFPENIFTTFFKSALPDDITTVHKASSLIVKELEKDTQAVALIPSLELINHKELFVSGKFGVSFDGILSNAYYYFVMGERQLSKIFVRGDVSINEIILAKILFEERYSSTVDLVLDTSENISAGSDYIICGDDNYTEQKYQQGISLADEVAEMIDHPYANYVFVSKDRESLMNFERLFLKLDETIEDALPATLKNMKLSLADHEFITSNFGSVYFELTENEKDGLSELVKLVYYHGIIEDMFDIKFI